MIFFNQVKIWLRSVLNPLVTVKLQLSGDLFLFLSCPDCIKNKVDILYSRSFICYNTPVI